MNVLVWLAIILLVLMVWVGGKSGVRSFFSLFLNFGVVFFTMFFMLDPNTNPIVITFIASSVIGCISLFYINEVNSKTVLAFISTMITISILLFFIVFVSQKLMIQGFGEEGEEAIAGLSLYIGVDFVKIGASVIIMSTIGAIMDVAISIASTVHEVFKHTPTLSKRELFKSGVSIGRDILGTDTNTLFFAFFGGYLALLIWFKDLHYSIGDIINSKIFSSEMILILCAGLGIALVIPIASWMNAYYLVRTREKIEKM
ncbi:YibE/F family protein [Sporosarcina sp. P26b]|uniref:YibE/F family protein n=1 Tax=Sporosarcina TaxID=1569 RepID=UPI000A17CF73|nr:MULTISPECIES: YibE/F family protein [Sporosarcina]ARK21634.1 YibE/F [Sporosarcina ureae]PIC74496.1 YibE/F family protein [Sporosarcina sp. P17b]PIC94639.1 YibE/F family protein [Sporosarcina sp. P26b]